MQDVVIIGAGPIGSFLAGQLASCGRKTLVLDKSKEPGQNVCCTGIISKECLDLLDVNSSIKVKKTTAAKFVDSHGKHFYIKPKDYLAYIIERPALNTVLVDKARYRGVEYAFSSLVTGIEIKSDKAVITAVELGMQHKIESKVVVIASGFNSKLLNSLNLGKLPDFLIGIQAEVKATNGEDIEIYLDHELAPGGFAWLAPIWDRKCLVGLLCNSNPRKYLDQFLSKLKADEKISFSEYTVGSGLIPTRPLKKTYRERLIIVGEAAGQVKPITGGGIYYGILCAEIAAKVIDNAFKTNDFSEKSFSEYQKLWHGRLNSELIFDQYLQRFFSNLSNRQIRYIAGLVRRHGLTKIFDNTEKFQFDWHSKAAVELIKYSIPFFKRG
jgi:digeranylgeranylglycerophospholipid reductase